MSQGLKAISPAARKPMVMRSWTWLITCDNKMVLPIVCCLARSSLS